MADFRVLSENYFNVHQFNAHAITASTASQVVGRESWRVGTGRRTTKNGWTGSTGTSWIRTACDQLRAPDMIALDGHNMAGTTAVVALQYTSSTASGWQTRFSYKLPNVTYQNTRLTDSPGARAEDGLWVHRFATTSTLPVATDFRIQISGSTFAPKIGLAWLGRSFTAKGLRPWEDESRTLARGSRVVSVLSGSLSARLNDLQGEQARYHVGDLAWSSGDPFIIVPHPDQAERAQVGFAPDGTRSMPYPTDWTHRVLEFDWVEHKPRPR